MRRFIIGIVTMLVFVSICQAQPIQPFIPTPESVEDYVGEMVTDNTETLIAVTYDDPNGKLGFVVDEAGIDHDNLTNYEPKEHIDWTNTSQNLLTSGEIKGKNVTVDGANGGVLTLNANTTIYAEYQGEMIISSNLLELDLDSELQVPTEFRVNKSGPPVSGISPAYGLRDVDYFYMSIGLSEFDRARMWMPNGLLDFSGSPSVTVGGITTDMAGIAMGGRHIRMNQGGGSGGGDLYMDGGDIKDVNSADIGGVLDVNDLTVNGIAGQSVTLTFGGGASGDCNSMTFAEGILTSYTTVP